MDRKVRTVSIIMSLGLTVSCSPRAVSPPGPTNREVSAPSAGQQRSNSEARRGDLPSSPAEEQLTPAAPGSRPAGKSVGATSAHPSTEASRRPGYEGPTSEVEDSPSDRESFGGTPAYTDIVAASIAEIPKGIRLSLRFAQPLPGHMPDDDSMFLGGFDVGSDSESGFSVVAISTVQGWDASFKNKASKKEFAGRFHVTGNRIEFTTSWSSIGGRRSFEWRAYGTLIEIIGQSAQRARSTDLAPNEGTAFFDSG